jgi:anti-sigma-K factor RskA
MADWHDGDGGDAAAYLLGALSDLERQAYERHLEGCVACREELEHLRPVAEALPRSVAPVRPPETMKQAVMEVVESEAHRDAPAAQPRRSLRGFLPSLTSRGPAVAWVSAAFLLVVGLAVGAGSALLVQGDRGRTVSARVDSVRVPEASGSLTVSHDESDGAILRVHGMPSLSSRETYQVWVQRNGEVVSQSIFNVGNDGDGAAAVPDDLEGADAVLVTREPAGGARAPSGRPMVSVDL